MTRNVTATTQCAVRSARLNRRTYSVAVGAAHPGVDAVAVHLPEPGHELRHELDPGQPLHVLVAVHLGDHEPHRCTVRAGERSVVHVMRKHDVRECRLPERQRVDVWVLERDEVGIAGLGQRLDHVPDRLEPHALPADAADRPAGDAVEVGGLPGRREVHQVVPREAHGIAHVPGHLEPVVRRVELRPRRVDGVDPPAADGEDVLQTLRDDRAGGAERPGEDARDPVSGEQPQAADPNERQKRRPADAPLAHSESMAEGFAGAGDAAHVVSHIALTVAADSPAMAGARLPSVLVVEDDAPVRRMLERTLAAEGYAVDAVADGGSALAHAEAAAPDAIVLDVSMPGMDGLAVARRLRSKGVATPILMLTARDGVHDRVAGLDAGADDYLVKPFAVVELAARMRALLRRTRPADVRTYADLAFDPGTRTVERGGRSIQLTAREADLLELLLRRPGRERERRRPVRRLSAPEARRSTADPHGARRRVRPAAVTAPERPRRRGSLRVRV